MATEYYLITSRHVGCFGSNWFNFWCADSRGYSQDIRYAGIYSEEDVKKKKYPILDYESYLNVRHKKNKIPDDYFVLKSEWDDKNKVFHLMEI